MENYFRVKGIPYQLLPLDAQRYAKLIMEKTGSTQMPALELSDGQWMSDSAAIIRWFEANYPTPQVTPIDPLQGFFSLLLEDYADEWLWRQKELPMDAGLCSQLPFYVDAKMIEIYE